MSLQSQNFQIECQPMLFEPAIPMATEADFDNLCMLPEVDLFQSSDSDNYAYPNADTCPDCAGGMIRQGRCCACPSCGYESCLM